MDRGTANPLQMARNCKGFTQEQLAEKLDKSTDSVQAWERGTRIPSPETLNALALCLDAPWLPVIFMRKRIDPLCEIIPDFQVGRPISEAAAAFIRCILDLVDNQSNRHLLYMVADGRIDELEATVYHEIMLAATQINKAYFEMRFASKKKEV